LEFKTLALQKAHRGAQAPDPGRETAGRPGRGKARHAKEVVLNNFHSLITPEQAKKMDDATPNGRRKPLSYYERLTKNHSVCENCDEKVWRLVDTGLCFSCTTGQADASGDYELIEEW